MTHAAALLYYRTAGVLACHHHHSSPLTKDRLRLLQYPGQDLDRTRTGTGLPVPVVSQAVTTGTFALVFLLRGIVTGCGTVARTVRTLKKKKKKKRKTALSRVVSYVFRFPSSVENSSLSMRAHLPPPRPLRLSPTTIPIPRRANERFLSHNAQEKKTDKGK
jgi:hypothetical protein